MDEVSKLELIVETLTHLKSSNERLSRRNKELNEMIVELKLLIARIYNKVSKSI